MRRTSHAIPPKRIHVILPGDLYALLALRLYNPVNQSGYEYGALTRLITSLLRNWVAQDTTTRQQQKESS